MGGLRGAAHPRRWAPAGALACVLLVGQSGCRKAVPEARFPIRRVEIEGAEDVAEAEVLEGLATMKSPRFLGLWDGLAFDYELYDPEVVKADIRRVERYYRSLGYYEAKVRATRIIYSESTRPREKKRRVRVIVQLEVDEGPPAGPYEEGRESKAVLVRRISMQGIEGLPVDRRGRPLAALVLNARSFNDCRLAPDRTHCEDGDPFVEEEFEATKNAIGEVLANHGYAFVRVEARAEVDVAAHVADVTYTVQPGPRARFGAVTISGLQRIPEQKVRARLLVKPGHRYSRRRIRVAQDELTALGRFTDVQISEDLTHPETGEVPIHIQLTESKLRGVRAGIGGEADDLKLSAHTLVGWEHRNFLGGMRAFRAEDRFGTVFFPLRMGRSDPFVRLLPENYLRITGRQPSFLEGRTDAVFRAEVNTYPILYRLPEEATADEERILGYVELRAIAGLERRFLRRRLAVTPSYNWNQNLPITYRKKGDRPEGMDPVLVIYPELYTDFDLRDDPVMPHSGVRLVNTFQMAGWLGLGHVADYRIQPELSLYVPISKTVTLASRTTVGFVFPQNYGETLDPEYLERSALDPADAAAIRDQSKLLFRVFYSGGANSNRGYPFRGIGPHGPLGFLAPTAIECSFDPADNSPPACNRPLGGLSLWETSLEVRFPIWGALRGVVFVDTSDVHRQRATLRVDNPHPSPGFGIRYLTPIGPLRVDVGFRLPRTEQQELANEPEIEPLLGVPMSLHLAIGEAF